MSFRIGLALLICVIGALVFMLKSPPPDRYRLLGLVAFAVGLWWAISTAPLHIVGLNP